MPFSRSSLGISAGRASAAAVSIISVAQGGLQKQLRQPSLKQRCALQAGAAGCTQTLNWLPQAWRPVSGHSQASHRN